MATSVQVSKTAVGVDIIEIGRIKRAVSRWQDSFLTRIYTENELKIARNVSSLAARFAAKEAVMKALGTGFRRIGWREIEIVNSTDGAPSVKLYGRALRRSHELGLTRFEISISHSRKYAIAMVMAHAE